MNKLYVIAMCLITLNAEAVTLKLPQLPSVPSAAPYAPGQEKKDPTPIPAPVVIATPTPAPIVNNDLTGFVQFVQSYGGYHSIPKFAHFNGLVYAAWIDVNNYPQIAIKENNTWVKQSYATSPCIQNGFDMRDEGTALFLYWMDSNNNFLVLQLK